MATITSVGTGAWSASGTWDSGVPADGDDVIIASGHTVTFDVDQSGFSTGVKVTITGTLTHTTATGTFCLFAKTGKSINGAGTWNIGTSGAGAIPFASKHTITGADGWYIGENPTITVYGAEPSIKYVKLTGAEAIGQTVLEVDTDVTGDIWAVGDYVVVCEINKATRGCEYYQIASGGIASGSITLTSGLSVAKNSGALVVLRTRNIRFVHSGTSNQIFYLNNYLTLGGGEYITEGKYVAHMCNQMVISGGVFTGNDHTINGSSGAMSGGVITNSTTAFRSSTFNITDCILIGNNLALYGGHCLMTGGFISCATGTQELKSSLIKDVTFYGCNYAINNNYSGAYTNITFTSNTYDLREVDGIGKNITLTSSTEHYLYSDLDTPESYLDLLDFAGVSGAEKIWTKGGSIATQNTVVPSGFSQAYIYTLVSATQYVFIRRDIVVPAGEIINILVWLRKNASTTILPEAHICYAGKENVSAIDAIDTFTMTDSINTWESGTLTVDNSAGDFDIPIVLYIRDVAAGHTSYAAFDITTDCGTGGTSSVKILPCVGKVGL